MIIICVQEEGKLNCSKCKSAYWLLHLKSRKESKWWEIKSHEKNSHGKSYKQFSNGPNRRIKKQEFGHLCKRTSHYKTDYSKFTHGWTSKTNKKGLTKKQRPNKDEVDPLVGKGNCQRRLNWNCWAKGRVGILLRISC